MLSEYHFEIVTSMVKPIILWYYCKFCGKLLYRVIIKWQEVGSQKSEENSILTIVSLICSNRCK